MYDFLCFFVFQISHLKSSLCRRGPDVCSRIALTAPARTEGKSTRRNLYNRSFVPNDTSHEYSTNETPSLPSAVYMSLFGSVLHLRGDGVTQQPVIDEASGNVLAWNGEVFGGVEVCLW